MYTKLYPCLKDTSRKATYKMNEIVNKFLLDSDKFMPEMHLKQPGFTYSARGPFTENKERRTASDKILRDKAFSIAKNPKYDGY